MTQSICKNPWLFACQWYKVEDIHRSITRSEHLSQFGEPIAVPKDDVTSREFAEWLTDQYRLAMRKGAELAIAEITEHDEPDDEFLDEDSLEGCDGKRYEIKTIDDLLRIPPDRLHDCLAELETSIELAHAMAACATITSIGEGLKEVNATLPSWTWIDDGKRDQDLSFCGLKVELKSNEDRLQSRIESRKADAKQWLQRVTELAEREEWDLLKHECYHGASIFQYLNDDLNELADREDE